MAEQPSPIARGFFREAEDGAAVFFPWGLPHRGYRLSDPAARRRAERAVSLLVGCVVAVGTWGGHAAYRASPGGAPSPEQTLGALALPLGALALILSAYALWASRFVEGLLPSDLRVSREERMREAAALAEPRKVIALGLLTAALSALLVALEPSAWWLAALGVAMGLGLAGWGRALGRAKRSG